MAFDFIKIVLIIHVTALAVYILFLKRRFRQRQGILQAIIDSYGEPLLFYNDNDRLVYLNDQGKTAFSDISEHIN